MAKGVWDSRVKQSTFGTLGFLSLCNVNCWCWSQALCEDRENLKYSEGSVLSCCTWSHLNFPQSSQGVQGLVEGGVVDEPVQSHWGLFPQTGSPEGLTQGLPPVLKLSADRLDTWTHSGCCSADPVNASDLRWSCGKQHERKCYQHQWNRWEWIESESVSLMGRTQLCCSVFLLQSTVFSQSL